MSTVETFTFTGVNRPMNADNMTQFEQMHVPGISCPNKVAPGDRFEVAIEVGKLYAHPSEHTHFIEFLDLYADETFLARADLTPVSTAPIVRFRIALDGPIDMLRAYARCNLHGVWIGERGVDVSE